MILIGLILQTIEVLIFVAVGLIFLIVPFLGAIVLVLAVIGIVWLVLVYTYSYQRTREGDYAGARTPTIVFAILTLLTLGIISGILYLIAYVKLGDAESAQVTPQFAPQPAFPYAPGNPAATPGSKFCTYCGRQNLATSKFCAGCGAALG